MTKALALLFAIVLVLALAALQVSAQQCTESGLFCIGSCNYMVCEGAVRISGPRALPPNSVCHQSENSILLAYDEENPCASAVACPQNRYECVDENTFLDCDSSNQPVYRQCPAGTVCNNFSPGVYSPCVPPFNA